ncbi:hypothetical protein GCM10009718_35060 [Isoptericola halotolerans]|uniref:Peptidase inhibitor family I36 n=1 Tax=Isoptericola halotolerans TaxID=300560 RepID=A0ABX2A3J9_9MICO|nr:hypothetical protein [Isoptericola halotolerans]NOV97151.1 hypothetical protein [Isoptericola halotolerans]
MPRTRTLVVGAAATVLAAGLALAAPVAWLEVDEAAAPPISALADLPDGAQVTAIDRSCGSGGCWLVYSVLPRTGTSPQELADAVAPQGEVCSVRSVVDLRRVCTWTDEVGLTEVRFGVRYDRHLDL